MQLWVDEPGPVRDSAPVLAVNGRPIGAATESVGRHLLTVVTDDPSVHPGAAVTVWSPASTAPRSGGGGRALAAPSPPRRAGRADHLRRPRLVRAVQRGPQRVRPR